MSDSIVLNFHETLLRESDLNLLRGNEWLNDMIISFYFEYLEKIAYQDRPELLFVSPQVTQCLKMVDGSDFGMFLDPIDFKSKEFAFFALNDNEMSETAGGTHWSLLVYSKCEKTFFYLNSLYSAVCDEARVLYKNFKYYFNSIGELGNEMKIVPLKCLKQDNGFDCGIHVICNVDILAEHVLKAKKILPNYPIIDSSSIGRKRGDLIKIIEELAKNK